MWGVLAKGHLHITILPKGQCMNRWWFAWIIKSYFSMWLHGCDLVVQDFEKCLRCDEPLAEYKKINVQVLPKYPKCSQDLNAIENAWKLLRERMYSTMPDYLEPRDEFITRVRNSARWLNANSHDQLLYLCSNQKERADDVIEMEGGRTKW